MLNIKRAFKTMNKEGSGTSLYYRLPNSNVLVSNSHIIVTVSNMFFEENKDVLNNLHENPILLDIALDIARINAEGQTTNVKDTSLVYECDNKLFRILKPEYGKLVAVNEKYLQVFDDCEKSHVFVTRKPKTSASAIKTPLFNCVVIEDTKEIYDFNCILPVYMDCEARLNKVLN